MEDNYIKDIIEDKINELGLNYFINLNTNGEIDRIDSNGMLTGKNEFTVKYDGEYDSEYIYDSFVKPINNIIDINDISLEEYKKIHNSTNKKEEIRKILFEKLSKKGNFDYNNFSELDKELTPEESISIRIDNFNSGLKTFAESEKKELITFMEGLKQKFNNENELDIINKNIEKLKNSKLEPNPYSIEEIKNILEELDLIQELNDQYSNLINTGDIHTFDETMEYLDKIFKEYINEPEIKNNVDEERIADEKAQMMHYKEMLNQARENIDNKSSNQKM